MFHVHVHAPLPTQQQSKGACSAEGKLQTKHILTDTHTKRMQHEIKKKQLHHLMYYQLKVINNYKKETETERQKQRQRDRVTERQRQRQRERSKHGKKGRRDERGANVTGAKTQNEIKQSTIKNSRVTFSNSHISALLNLAFMCEENQHNSQQSLCTNTSFTYESDPQIPFHNLQTLKGTFSFKEHPFCRQRE